MIGIVISSILQNSPSLGAVILMIYYVQKKVNDNEKRIEETEKKIEIIESSINEIKEFLAEIKTDIKWVVKYINGNNGK